MNDRKPPLEQEAKRLLQQASRELPAQLEQRLQQARQQALATSASVRPRLSRQLWLPTSALALSCALLLLWMPSPQPKPTVAAAHALSSTNQLDNELPPDAGQEDPGLYQDLAFYNWLAAQPAADRLH